MAIRIQAGFMTLPAADGGSLPLFVQHALSRVEKVIESQSTLVRRISEIGMVAHESGNGRSASRWLAVLAAKRPVTIGAVGVGDVRQCGLAPMLAVAGGA